MAVFVYELASKAQSYPAPPAYHLHLRLIPTRSAPPPHFHDLLARPGTNLASLFLTHGGFAGKAVRGTVSAPSGSSTPTTRAAGACRRWRFFSACTQRRAVPPRRGWRRGGGLEGRGEARAWGDRRAAPSKPPSDIACWQPATRSNQGIEDDIVIDGIVFSETWTATGTDNRNGEVDVADFNSAVVVS